MKGENECRRPAIVRTTLEALYAFTHLLAPVLPIAAQTGTTKMTYLWLIHMMYTYTTFFHSTSHYFLFNTYEIYIHNNSFMFYCTLKDLLLSYSLILHSLSLLLHHSPSFLIPFIPICSSVSILSDLSCLLPPPTPPPTPPSMRPLLQPLITSDSLLLFLL